MDADLGRLVHEEASDVVERRRLRRDLLTSAPRRARLRLDHVELDEVDARLERSTERRERVLGGERRGAPVSDPQRAALSPLERDHGVGLVGR